MKVRSITAAWVAVVTSSIVALIGAPAAGASPDVVGMRYGEAKGVIWQENIRPVVATIVGDRLPQDQCFVMSASQVTTRDSSGAPTNTPEMQLNLSCYKQTTANSKQPGYSAGNSNSNVVALREGDEAATKRWKQSEEGQEWCAETEAANPDWGPLPDCHPEDE